MPGNEASRDDLSQGYIGALIPKVSTPPGQGVWPQLLSSMPMELRMNDVAKKSTFALVYRARH